MEGEKTSKDTTENKRGRRDEMDQSEEMEIQSNEEVLSTMRKKSIITTSFRAVWDDFFSFWKEENRAEEEGGTEEAEDV